MTNGTTFPVDVTVAVVCHNSSGMLPGVLDAIAATGCPPSRILAVDVASTDDTVAIVRARVPDAAVLRFGTNEGPNPGRNAALRAARTPYVLLMDADVLLTPAVPAALRAAMDEPGVAIGTPVVVHAQEPTRIQYAGGGLHFICEAVNRWMDRDVAERGDAAEDIGAAPGCALMIDVARSLAIGGFDERYFMGKEDGDFLHRTRIAGWRIREMPSARVLHHSRPRSAWLFMYQVRNRWHFLLRNYELRTLVLLAPALFVHEALQFAVLVLKGHLGAWLRAIAGLARMLPALPGDRRVVRGYRRRGDRTLFRADPLIVRADLGSGALKGWYDRWLQAYWRLVQPLVRA